MKKSWSLVLLFFMVMIGSQCTLFEAFVEEEDTPLTIDDILDENQKFSLDPPRALDLDEPVREESLVDDTPGFYSDESGQSYVTQWNVTRKHYSAVTNPGEFVLFNANASVLWPGNLIQGQSMQSGSLDPIPLSSRKPITVYCTTVQGNNSGSGFREINDPSGSTMTQAMNEIVTDFYGTSAMFSYTREEIHSSEQLAFSLDAEYSNVTMDLEASLGIDWTEEKQRVLITLQQQYFTMAIDNPPGWRGLFGESVTPSEIQPYTSPDNPMVYIDSVTYGRVFYYLYETYDSSFDLVTELDMAYDSGVISGDLNAQNAYSRVLSNATVKCFAMGGNASDALSAASSLDSLQTYLQAGASVSEQSIGIPISYTMRYLKDATLLKMNNTLEYYVDEKNPVLSASTAAESQVTITFNQVILNGDDGNGPDMVDVALDVHTLNSTTNDAFSNSYNHRLGDHNFSDHSPKTITVGARHVFTVPKEKDSQIRITLSGRESDDNGDTHFYNGQNDRVNYIDLYYDIPSDSWTQSDKTAPQIQAFANDPDDGGEWSSGDVYYTLSIQDITPVD